MWEYVPLENAAEICDGLRKPINSQERAKRIEGKSKDSLYPYYGATGQVGYIDDYLTEGEFVLLGEDGAPFLNPFASKAYIINGKAWVNNHAHILRSKTNNRFLCYFLNYFNYKGYVSGTTRLKLTQAQMKQIKVPVPPLDEQARIVARIEELFSELDNGVQTLQTIKQQLAVYRQAVLKEAFERIPGEDYCKLKDVMSVPPQNGVYKPQSLYGSGTRILRIDGFYDGRIVRDYDYKRVKLTEEECQKYMLGIGDVVVNRVNSMTHLGKCALIRRLKEHTVFESNIMRFKLDERKIDLEYATYYLASSFGRDELIKNAKQAVNQASINQTDVRNAMIPVPANLNVQREIVRTISARLSVCDSIEKTVDTALAQAEAMRQSILKKAFEGGLA